MLLRTHQRRQDESVVGCRLEYFCVDFPADITGKEMGKVGQVANQIEEKIEKIIV